MDMLEANLEVRSTFVVVRGCSVVRGKFGSQRHIYTSKRLFCRLEAHL